MQTSPSRVNPVRAHRRDVWLKIIFPVALPMLLVIALCVVLAVGVATGKLERDQITIVMNVVATAFIALPMMLLCLIPYVTLALLAWLSGKGYAHARTPLRVARRLTGQIAVKTDQFAPRITAPLVRLNVWVTRMEHIVRGWQQTAPLPKTKETNDDRPT